MSSELIAVVNQSVYVIYSSHESSALQVEVMALSQMTDSPDGQTTNNDGMRSIVCDIICFNISFTLSHTYSVVTEDTHVSPIIHIHLCDMLLEYVSNGR